MSELKLYNIPDYNPEGSSGDDIVPSGSTVEKSTSNATQPTPQSGITREEVQAMIAAAQLTQDVGQQKLVSGMIQSANFVTGVQGWQLLPNGNLEANNGTFRGAISATTIDIGGADATSFHVDIDGNLWLGAATFATAPWRVSNIGDQDVGGTDATSWHVDNAGNMWSGAATFAAATAKISNTGTITATSASFTTQNVTITNTNNDIVRFGGDGTDGALDTSGGTVNIDLGAAQIVEKNYTSINIVTNNLTFSNPHANGTLVTLKSQGAVTITATANDSGMGAAPGTPGGAGVVGAADGNDGTSATSNGIMTFGLTTQGPGLSAKGTKGTLVGPAGSGGAGGAKVSFFNSLYGSRYRLTTGSGGSAGGSGAAGVGATSGTGGAGSRGGGALIIECRGALNFTGTITVAGTAGVVGADATGAGNACGGGGGGGGGGGTIVVLYNTLTANSGTLTVAGGTGGAAGANVGTPSATIGAGGGGGGGSLADGSNGAGGGSSSGAGGAGGAGQSLVAKNVWFA